MNYKVKEVFPKIFSVEIPDSYNRAMLFLRSQEYYESPFPEFKGHHFDLFDFMDKYKEWKGLGYFSYPQDWGGFNIPGQVVEECINHVLDIRNGILPTKYDYIMSDIIKFVSTQIQSGEKYYLLGVDSFESTKTTQHEVAHGLYYTNDTYKQEMDNLVTSLPIDISAEMKTILMDMGYCNEVLTDEIQAYMSTGLFDGMNKISGIKDEMGGFKKVFKKYYKK